MEFESFCSSSMIFSRMYGLSGICSPNYPRAQIKAALLLTSVIKSKFSFVKNGMNSLINSLYLRRMSFRTIRVSLLT